MASNGIILLADDLTGAADSAVAFACHGHRARILLVTGEIPDDADGITAINLDSRDAREEQLVERNSAVMASLHDAQLCIRKIDSMLRGNTLREIAVLAQMNLGVPIVLAPAHPIMGRQIVNGDLRWSDAHHQGVVSLRSVLEEQGIECVSFNREDLVGKLADAVHKETSEKPRVLLCDSAVQQDLDTIVDSVLAAGRKVLWCGSGGLALALAARYAKPGVATHRHDARGGKALFIIGSNHPVTRSQAANLLEADPRNASILLVMRGVTTEADIQRWIEEQRGSDIGCLLLTGGDTALLVCRAVGARALEVISEFEPGVPLTRFRGGMLDGVDALLKSGGFGESGLFQRVAAKYCMNQESFR